MRRHLLAAAILLAAGCTKSSDPASAPAANAPAPLAAPAPAVAAVAPVESAAPIVEGERTPLGDAPAPVAEPTVALDRSTPAKAVAALAAALDRQDAAALARLRSGSAAKPALDEQDLLRARLDFLGPREKHWRRVLAAIDAAKLAALDASSERATLRVDVGGALGAVNLVFVKEGGAWAVGL